MSSAKYIKKKLGKDNFLCCYGRFKKFQKILLESLGCHDWTNKSGSSKGHFKDTIFWKKKSVEIDADIYYRFGNLEK